MSKVIILGICGKLMAGIAVLAKEKGLHVIGYDRCYAPPMKNVLLTLDITLINGYPSTLELQQGDMVIVGNQIRRNEPCIQDLVSKRVKLYSAPEWLMDNVLRDRFVIAITGSHGKTTITSMLAWVLTQQGLDPGYLIGGMVSQLGTCAKLGTSKYFVIEADEYDTAFFDKRPKFMHYWPSLLVISHIEYDHADIYPTLEAQVLQYKYLLRLLPKKCAVIATNVGKALYDQIQSFSLFYIPYGIQRNQLNSQDEKIPLSVMGAFNQENAQAVLAVSNQLKLDEDKTKQALQSFTGADRRQKLMIRGCITAYDDFAHHPTALRKIFEALSVYDRVHLVYHPATYTQRLGEMDLEVITAMQSASGYILLPTKHNLKINLYKENNIKVFSNETSLVQSLIAEVKPGQVIVFCSAYYMSSFWCDLYKALRKKQRQIIAFFEEGE